MAHGPGSGPRSPPLPPMAWQTRAGSLKHLCASPGIARHVERRRIALHDLAALAWVVLEQRACRRRIASSTFMMSRRFWSKSRFQGWTVPALSASMSIQLRASSASSASAASERTAGVKCAQRSIRSVPIAFRSPSERAHGRDLHGLGLAEGPPATRASSDPWRHRARQPDRIGALAFVGRPGARGRLRARERFPRGGVLAHTGNRKQVQGASAHRG